MPENPATPKTIHSVGNSGNAGYETGGRMVGVVTGFVRTAIGVQRTGGSTGRGLSFYLLDVCYQ